MSGLLLIISSRKIKKKCKEIIKYNINISSPGYGLSLVGETTNGFFFSADIVNYSNTTDEDEDVKLSPEDLSRKCAMKLLDEIFYVNILF